MLILIDHDKSHIDTVIATVTTKIDTKMIYSKTQRYMYNEYHCTHICVTS